MNSGIYCIWNKKNHKFYIGSTTNLRTRKRGHFSYLSRGKHHNKHLQYSYNKYGKDCFIFSVVEIVLQGTKSIQQIKDELLKIEQRYLSLLKPVYNKRLLAESNLGIKGWKHTEETKKKQSILRKGRKIHTEEWKEKMSEMFKGVPRSMETRKRMSESRKGKFLTEEWKKKLSESHRRGENSSRFQGVTWNKVRNTWSVVGRFLGKTKYLGSFSFEDEAAYVVNLFYKEHYPEEDVPNDVLILDEDKQKLEDLYKLAYKDKKCKKQKKGCSSKYLGVSWNKEKKKWYSEMKLNGIKFRIGRYKEEKEAARAVNLFYVFHYPDLPCPNPDAEDEWNPVIKM